MLSFCWVVKISSFTSSVGAAATALLPKLPATITKSKMLTLLSPLTSPDKPAPLLPNCPATITRSKMLTELSPLTSPASLGLVTGFSSSPATVMTVCIGSANPSAFSALTITA